MDAHNQNAIGAALNRTLLNRHNCSPVAYEPVLNPRIPPPPLACWGWPPLLGRGGILSETAKQF